MNATALNGDAAELNGDEAVHQRADAVLRRLACRALGLTGADIERLVREARQRARREQRRLTYADLDHLLSASRPTISPHHRRRMAVHEAGHALARIVLGVGELKVITIDSVEGGYTEVFSSSLEHDLIDTAESCQRHLVVTMAGRAAEQVAFGSAHAGSGGSMHSDLARATELATACGCAESSWDTGRPGTCGTGRAGEGSRHLQDGNGCRLLTLHRRVVRPDGTYRPPSIRTNASRHCIITIVRSCRLHPVGCVSVAHWRHLS